MCLRAEVPAAVSSCSTVHNARAALGLRLRKHGLAEQFSVTHASLRELLTALEQTGLAEQDSNRGTAVPRDDAEEADRPKHIQLCSTRTAVERYHAYLL